MGSAVPGTVNVLVGVSLRRARPRRILLVSGPIADPFEAGRVSDRRRWRWRRFVSFIERKRVAVESEALAVPVPTNKETYPLTAHASTGQPLVVATDRLWKALHCSSLTPPLSFPHRVPAIIRQRIALVISTRRAMNHFAGVFPGNPGIRSRVIIEPLY